MAHSRTRAPQQRMRTIQASPYKRISTCTIHAYKHMHLNCFSHHNLRPTPIPQNECCMYGLIPAAITVYSIQATLCTCQVHSIHTLYTHASMHALTQLWPLPPFLRSLAASACGSQYAYSNLMHSTKTFVRRAECTEMKTNLEHVYVCMYGI